MGRFRFAMLLIAATASAAPAGPARESAPAGASNDRLQLIRDLLVARDSATAEQREEEILDELRGPDGEVTRAYAIALERLVDNRRQAGKAAGRTLELAGRAVLAHSELEGSQGASLAPALEALGYLLHVDGDLERAREVYRWALELRRARAGSGHPATAASLKGLGHVEASLGNLERSERLLRDALAILEGHYGPLHEEVGDALFGLALFLFEQERFDEAKEIWRRTLELFEELLQEEAKHGAVGTARRDDLEYQVSRALHNLGEVSHRQGDIAAAFDYLDRALRMRLRQSQPGRQPMHSIANTYSALADLAQDVGEFARAREYYEEALRRLAEWFGEDPFRFAETLSRSALLQERTGAWDEALAAQERVLAIRRSKLAANDPLIAVTLQRLGALRLRRGDPEAAAVALGEALVLQLAGRQANSPELAATLSSLAELAESEGRSEEARLHLEAAVGALEELKKDHPARIDSLVHLARLERERGNLAEADRRLGQGLQAARLAYGDDSPQSYPLLREKALLSLVSGDLSAAVVASIAAETRRREHVRSTIPYFPERQALVFTGMAAPALDPAISALEIPHSETRRDQTTALWDSVVRSRAIVFDAVASRQRVLAARADPMLDALAEDLSRARARLAGLMVRGPGTGSGSGYRRALDEARRWSAAAERALADASQSDLEASGRAEIGLESVRDALPEDSALVAVIRHHRYATHWAGGRVPFYSAFVLPARGGNAVLRPLAPAEKVEAAVRSWREAAVAGQKGGEGESKLRRLGDDLRRLVWDPLASDLTRARRVFLVSDGLLHLVNPAALPSRDGGYLIENGLEFHVLASERDLVVQSSRIADGSGLLAIGGADFDSRSALAAASASTSPADGTAVARGWSGCRRFERHLFPALPASLREVEEIARIWRRRRQPAEAPGNAPARVVDRLIGVAASERAFKEHAPGHEVLHLATHGFFLQGACSTGHRSFEPLALSGLALAGANLRGEAKATQEDGILTASEISIMDLSGVRWAVLSACDTGVGDIRDAEGVLGLQRAFAVAGAKTVIMSLWPVEDEVARRWMSALYRSHFIAGDDTARAVHRASLEILQARRRAGESTHPAFWAGFVASGDWK